MRFSHDNLEFANKDFLFDFYEGKARKLDDKSNLHNHDCLEINYCTKGSGKYYIGDDVYDINVGDLFVINNLEYHMAFSEEDLILKIITFSPEMIWSNDNAFDSRYLKAFFEWKENFKHRFTSEMLMVPEIAVIIFEIQKEWENKQEGYRLVVKSLLLKILALLYRNFSMSKSTSQKTMKFQTNYNKIFDAVSYIDNNFQKEIKLEELSATANFVPNYFSKIFNEVMSISVPNYINKKRIEHACVLLKSTTIPVKEIADKSGFNNIAHFNKTFKLLMKVSPKVYRKESII